MMMRMKAMTRMSLKVMKMIQRLSTNMLELGAREGQRQPLGDLGSYN